MLRFWRYCRDVSSFENCQGFGKQKIAMNYKKFINGVSYGLLGLLIILILLYNFKILAKDELVAIIASKLIMTANFLIGMNLSVKGLKKPHEMFMIYLFGGMTVRIFLSAVLLLLCMYLLKFNFNYLIFSFFIFYIIFLTLEIWFLIKNEVKIFNK